MWLWSHTKNLHPNKECCQNCRKKITFAQKLSCLNNKGMATESSEGNITAFRALVWHLNEARDADSVISQYKKFLEEVVPQNKSKFLDSSHRVDQLYLLAGSDDYGQLWSVVKMVLLLSHGQATAESWFSVNRQVDDDNLLADTFCCRRLICDTVTVAYYGGIYAIDTSNKALLLSCSSAWHKYQLDLEQKKKDAMKDTMTRKSLKRRKLELSTDIDSLTASAD